MPIVVGLSAPDVQALRVGLHPIPMPLSARALLDTGAEVTGIDPSLAKGLGLLGGGTVLVNLPAHGGMGIGFLHNISLTIVHPSGNSQDDLVFRDLSVLEMPLAALGYQAVIGRDVLIHCRFLFDGPGNQFVLSYQ